MIKEILITLIAIMLCAIPIMADAPHDCDVNNDGTVNIIDKNLVTAAYGSYDYWHPYDFNRDFSINYNDIKILNSVNTGWYLNDNEMYSVPISIGDNNFFSVYQVNQDEVMIWLVYWNVINTHKYHTHPDGYTCNQFAIDTTINFENDMEFRGFHFVSDDAAFHSYNAILIGDNPLNKDDWTFIEPQLDRVRSAPSTFTIGLDAYKGAGGAIYWDEHIIWYDGEQYGTWFPE